MEYLFNLSSDPTQTNTPSLTKLKHLLTGIEVSTKKNHYGADYSKLVLYIILFSIIMIQA